MKQKIAKRFLFCILALLPFPIMALLTKLFFMDVYLPSWMYENKFEYIWADGMFYLAVAYGIFRIVRHIVKKEVSHKDR